MSACAPSLVSEPLPDIAFTNEMSSLRLKVRFALFVTLPLIEPVVLPAPTERVPAVIVVPPEYVLVFVSSRVPVPSFVSIIEVPDTTPLSRAVVDDATETVELAAIATVPDNVPAAEKFTAPADEIPVPEIVNGSADDTADPTSSVAPSATVVPVPEPPRALVWVILMVPADTSVAPV